MASSSTGDPDLDAVLSGTTDQPQATSSGDPDLDAVLKQSSAAPPSWLSQNVGRPLGVALRNVIEGASSVPMLAANAGVQARNFIENPHVPSLSELNPFSKQGMSGGKYPMPSAMLDQSLTQAGLPEPKGFVERLASAAEQMLTGAAVPIKGPPSEVPENFSAPSGESKLTGAQQSAMESGKSVGMQATPGQERASASLQQLESKLESQPWTSGPANAIRESNQTALNRTWARAIGENSDTVDSDVLSHANSRLGDAFEAVRDARPRTIDPDAFLGNMKDIEDEFSGMLPNGMSIADHPLVNQLVNFAEDGKATGAQLGNLSSKLGRVAFNNMTSANGDRELGMALFRAKDVTDDLVGQGMTAEQAADYATTRQQYRSLMQLTSGPGRVNATTGNVSGPNMAAFLQAKDKPGFFMGGNQSPQYSATRFAQAFKPIVGNSGTATRSPSITNWQDLITSPIGLPANILSRLYYRPWTMNEDIAQKGLQSVLPLSQQDFDKPQ